MKKTILLAATIAGCISLQSCSNSGTSTSADSTAVNADTNQTTDTGFDESDSDFMTKAASGGMMEVEAGRLAEQNAANADVKSFGSRMVADHSKANEELKALASSKNVMLPTAPQEPEQKHVTEMADLKGAEFDKHYMNMMVNDHDKTVAMFEDAANNAKDPEVKAWAAKTLPVLKEHQTAAKEINSKL